MKCNGIVKRGVSVLMALAIAAAAAGSAWAGPTAQEQERAAGEVSGAPAGAAANGTESEGDGPAASTDSAPPPEAPAPTDHPPDDPEAGAGSPAGNQLTADSYEVYATGGSKDTLDVIRKGRQAKLVVYVKTSGIKTNEVKKNKISVSKLHDSFSGSGAKVKVLSDKEDDLEFSVTFSKLTYRGTGDELKFRVSYQDSGIPSDVVTANIMECEEYGGGSGGGGGDTTGQPVIKIKRLSPSAPVRPGESFTLALELENTSKDGDIEDLVVSVNPSSAVFITDDSNSRVIRRLDTNRTSEVRLNMAAGEGIFGPSQVIDLELKFNYYSDGRLTSGSSAQKVLIPVSGGSAGQPFIKVSRGDLAGPVQAGQAFTVTVRLENTSKDKALRSLSATFEPNDQISLLDQTDTRLVGDLEPGQTAEIPVRLQAGAELSNAASQLLGMSLKFEYDTDKGITQGTYGEKLVIPVNAGRGKQNLPTPNVIIKNYSYGERVTAGQVFDLQMEMSNTSSLIPVENLVVSMDTGEGISINSSSNTFFIPKLEAGKDIREQVKVQALFQSKLQSPKITITFKYEYLDQKERRQVTSSEVIAIPVYQPDRFEIKTPVYSENMRAGEEGTITVPYVNKGRGQVFNVEARLECDVKALEKELTLGNVESGKSGTIDFVVTAETAGTFEGKVVVRYEDEAMQAKTLEAPVKFTVQETGEADMAFAGEDGIGEMQPPGPPKWVWLIGAGAAAILAAALFRLKRLGKRSGETETWDDEADDGLWDDQTGEEAEGSKTVEAGPLQVNLLEQDDEERDK